MVNKKNKNEDVSFEELQKLITQNKTRINSATNTTKESRELLKKINEKIEKQELAFINLISKISLIESPLDELNTNIENLSTSQINNEIRMILNELKTLRKDLANLLRK
jgi:phage-related protein